MSQIASSDVQSAISELENEPVGDLLTTDQLRQFDEIASESDPEVKANRTTQAIEKLLGEVEDGSTRLKKLLTDIGLEDGQVSGFLDSERFSDSSRVQIHESLEAYRNATISKASQEATQRSSVNTTAKTPRLHRRMV